MVEIVANPDLGIEAMLEVEPLLDAELELERLNFAIDELMRADETVAGGLGVVDDAKLAEAITVISEAYELDAALDASADYTSEFLPDMTERVWPEM